MFHAIRPSPFCLYTMRFTLYHLLMVNDYVSDRHSYYCLNYSILIHVFLRYCFSICNTLREGTHTRTQKGI
jgi:hypothetical protein